MYCFLFGLYGPSVGPPFVITCRASRLSRRRFRGRSVGGVARSNDGLPVARHQLHASSLDGILAGSCDL